MSGYEDKLSGIDGRSFGNEGADALPDPLTADKLAFLPDPDTLDMDGLQALMSRLEALLDELEDGEPDERDEAHDEWEQSIDEVAELLEEVESRIEDLEDE